jgi:hypothetical protein
MPIIAIGIAHAPAVAGARIVSRAPSISDLLFDLGPGARVARLRHLRALRSAPDRG